MWIHLSPYLLHPSLLILAAATASFILRGQTRRRNALLVLLLLGITLTPLRIMQTATTPMNLHHVINTVAGVSQEEKP